MIDSAGKLVRQAGELVMKERKGIRDFMDIDRTEVVENIFSWCDGELVLENGHWDIPDWTKEKKEEKIRRFEQGYDGDTIITGTYCGSVLVGFLIVDLEDRLGVYELTQIVVSNGYRNRGIGRNL